MPERLQVWVPCPEVSSLLMDCFVHATFHCLGELACTMQGLGICVVYFYPHTLLPHCLSCMTLPVLQTALPCAGGIILVWSAAFDLCLSCTRVWVRVSTQSRLLLTLRYVSWSTWVDFQWLGRQGSPCCHPQNRLTKFHLMQQNMLKLMPTHLQSLSAAGEWINPFIICSDNYQDIPHPVGSPYPVAPLLFLNWSVKCLSSAQRIWCPIVLLSNNWLMMARGSRLQNLMTSFPGLPSNI